ncbi:MAG: ABC transporter permease, partial [Gammaproteobacteria bacterium]
RLKRESAFAVIFIITLALGVGANAALFSALRGYFLAPLPYPDAGRLIVIDQGIQGARQISASTYDYLRRNARSISAGGLSHEAGGILTIGNSQAKKVRLDAVTASWFKTLGVAPFLGRTFGPNADKPNGPREVVLTYRFWQDAMHGDPNVVGKTLNINASPHTVVGVMPRGVYFPSQNVKFWIPLTINPAKLGPDAVFDMHGWRFVARLRPDVNLGAATRELNALAQRQVKLMSPGDQAHAKRNHYHIGTKTLRDSLVGSAGTRLLLIELGAALLLLLTIAILANLVTVRTLARRHEAALRMALGANRVALWRAALAETLPLGFIGGVLAVGLAWWGTTLIARYGIGTGGTAFSIALDLWVVLFSLVLGCVVGAIAALPAAFTSRKRLLARLSEGGRGGIGRHARLTQRGLSVAQIALGVALMINAALLGFAFKNASSHPIGVNASHLFIADLGFHGPRFHDQKSQLAFYNEFGNAMRALPGIKHTGVASELPFAGGLDSYGGLDGIGGIEPRGVSSVIEFVDGHALHALGTPLVHGRLIDAADIHAKTDVAVIDTLLARKLFGTTDAIGREIKLNQTYRVIGVIRPVRWRAHASGGSAGTMWLPYSTAPADSTFYAGPTMDLAVRSGLPLETVKRELETTLHKLAPNQAFGFIESMSDLKGHVYHGDQALPVLFGLFSLLALVLAAVGTYGTVAYLIRLRLGEFAVRQALGATPGRIGVLALAQGATLAVLGIVLGVVGGFLLARALSGLITGAGTGTATAYVAAALVMALAALGATAIPALRARRANLLSLLRPQ